MKTFKFTLMALLLAAITIPATATEDPVGTFSFKSKVLDDQSVVVYFFNLEKQDTEVSLKSIEGIPYFEERISTHNGYSLLLDLSNVSPGRYLLSARQGDTEAVQVILVSRNTILLSEVVK